MAPELLAELRGWAEQDLRSLNGQIEFLLLEAVRRRRKSFEVDRATDPNDRAPAEDDAGD